MQNKKETVLTVKKAFSDVNPVPCNFDTPKSLSVMIKNYFSQSSMDPIVVAYMQQGIFIGMFDDHATKPFVLYDDTVIEPAYLLSLRVFDRKKELHIYRRMGRFFGRMRIDGQSGAACEYVETAQLLWGDPNKNENIDNAWYRRYEERGVEIILPKALVKKEQENLFLISRNYIEYNEVGQAGYRDCRFVSITGEE